VIVQNVPMVKARRALGAALLVLAGILLPHAQEPPEILIRNGLVVTETGRLQADLRIRDGVIAEIGRHLAPAGGTRTIDAAGKLVLPGGIDTHVGAFIGQDPDVPAARTLAEAADAAIRTTIADAILHFTIGDPTRLVPTDLTMMRERGVTPKIFMRGMAFEQHLAGNLRLIEAAGKAGLLTQLHAEDAAILAGAMDRLVAQGRTALVGQNFADSHPVEAEEVATHRAVGFAEFTGAPIYLVHMSSERAVRVAEGARARGLPVFTEVRFIYLHLTRDAFNRPDGPTFTGAPPLRNQADRDYLWAALARGDLDVVNTDHVGYTRAEEMDPGNSIQRPREGSNFLQDQMPLLYSEGVGKGRISLERMVAVTATNPAKLFGLYPRKGAIAGRFSIFAGWEVTGWPVVTIRRGQVVYENGRVIAAPGSGRLAPRIRWQRP
jgi:dihydropyrimidinase